VTGILLVDDHAAFRQSLAFMLDREPDLRVVAQAGTLAEARSRLAGVDVAIISLGLPDSDSVQLFGALRSANLIGLALILRASPAELSLIFDPGTDHQVVEYAVKGSTTGVLNKSAGIEEIIDVVRRVSAGEPLRTTRKIVSLLETSGRQNALDREARVVLDRLTPREREVLQALAEGLTDKDIALRLHIGNETARTHMVNILRKLEVDSRLQAVVLAVRYGAVTIR
jgi:DNA-binding NarL/FixJ family response regulator